MTKLISPLKVRLSRVSENRLSLLLHLLLSRFLKTRRDNSRRTGLSSMIKVELMLRRSIWTSFTRLLRITEAKYLPISPTTSENIPTSRKTWNNITECSKATPLPNTLEPHRNSTETVLNSSNNSRLQWKKVSGEVCRRDLGPKLNLLYNRSQELSCATLPPSTGRTSKMSKFFFYFLLVNRRVLFSREMLLNSTEWTHLNMARDLLKCLRIKKKLQQLLKVTQSSMRRGSGNM